MPLIASSYQPEGIWRHMHFSTIYAAKLRWILGMPYARERLELEDGDFLDLDWSLPNSRGDTVAILLHGLEGDAQRPYMKGMARLLLKEHIDVVGVNFRGCSGTVNRHYRSYHSGETGDLQQVVAHLADSLNYTSILLYGISLGGNVIFKYLGESPTHPAVKAAVGVGVPCDLYHSLQQLNHRENWIYRLTFLRRLRKKYKEKMQQFPDRMSGSTLKKIKSLQDFDEYYTAPAHGFQSALDYYERASCYPVLPQLKTPALMINALNDSFLKERCYPFAFAKANPNFYLETPNYGGHVGFYQPETAYYHEQRALEFFKEQLG
ncbi:YheT family hydrolase [Croceiramulus getboli]|nr:alpha/beta fold hydrolase [Flavobacteriaceae bacterium YJPT1-3]